MKLIFAILILFSTVASAQVQTIDAHSWASWKSVPSFKTGVLGARTGTGYIFSSPITTDNLGNPVNPHTVMFVHVLLDGVVTEVPARINTPPSSWIGYFNNNAFLKPFKMANGSTGYYYVAPLRVTFEMVWKGGYHDEQFKYHPDYKHLWQPEFSVNF